MENKQEFHPCPSCACNCLGKRYKWSKRGIYNMVYTSAFICLAAAIPFIALLIVSDASLALRIKAQEPEIKRVFEVVKACQPAVDALNDDIFCGGFEGAETRRLLFRLEARDDPQCQNATILPTVDSILTCGIRVLRSDAKDTLWIVSLIFCILFGLGFVVLIAMYASWKFDEREHNTAYSQVGETEAIGSRETVEQAEHTESSPETANSTPTTVGAYTAVTVDSGVALV